MSALWLVLALWGPPAIHWTGGTVAEADALARMGVRHLVTERLLDTAVLDTLAAYGIRITSHSGVRHLTQAAFDTERELWMERITDPYHYYQAYPFYAGHVALVDPSPWLQFAGPGMRWHRSGDVTRSEPAGWRVHHEFDPHRFQIALDDTSVIHVIPDRWLQGESGPYIRVWLRDPGVRISVPAPEPQLPPARWNVWAILLVTGVWIGGFSMMPTYRRSHGRYWTTHTFFVTDVTQRRIRLGGTTLLLWVSSALLTGTYLMTLADLFLTDGGRDAAASVGIPTHPLALFGIGIGASLLWDGFLMAWLHLAGSRAPVLLMWPRHLHYPAVLALVAISGGSPIQPTAPYWIAAFPLIWLLAFPIAVGDHATTMGTKRMRFLLWTGLPYLILMATAAWWILTSDWIETLAMVVSIR